MLNFVCNNSISVIILRAKYHVVNLKHKMMLYNQISWAYAYARILVEHYNHFKNFLL